MGRYWRVNCPYCNAEIARGSGYGDTIPDIWVPFIRCDICGQLMKTDAKEYLTMPVEERIKLRNNADNCSYIAQSLDRTNNRDYVAILQKNGFTIYPITGADKEKFTRVPFERYINMLPSQTATQSLYAVGILIEESRLDKETGSFKQEVLDKNKNEYIKNQKILKTSIIVGAIVGVLFTALFGGINPDSYLFLIGIALGFVSAISVGLGMTYYYKNKEDPSNKSLKLKQKEHETDYKALIEQCGIRFFIKYYKQIKRLPLRDVIITENYNSVEKEERLLAAKKIIDLNLTEFTLKEILKSYSDILEAKEIEQVKALLSELQISTKQDPVELKIGTKQELASIKPTKKHNSLIKPLWDD